MKDNGGILDEVIFAAGTDVKEDLEYLDTVIPLHPNYIRGNDTHSGHRWWAWEYMNERESIYVKIDDDVVCRLSPRTLQYFFVLTWDDLGICRGRRLCCYRSAVACEPQLLRRVGQRREQSCALLGPSTYGCVTAVLARDDRADDEIVSERVASIRAPTLQGHSPRTRGLQP